MIYKLKNVYLCNKIYAYTIKLLKEISVFLMAIGLSNFIYENKRNYPFRFCFS